MDSTLIGQGLLSGFLFGGVYSLMAVGLTLIFGVMRVVNFAHGDMMVWGMYLAWLLASRAGIDPRTPSRMTLATGAASFLSAASALPARSSWTNPSTPFRRTITMIAGMMAINRVINRRSQGRRRILRNPSMTIWPASVPVIVAF